MDVPLRLRRSDSEVEKPARTPALVSPNPNSERAVTYASSSRGCKTAELVMSGFAARTSPGHAKDGALRLRLPESEVGDADPHQGMVSPKPPLREGNSNMRHRAAAAKLQSSS